MPKRPAQNVRRMKRLNATIPDWLKQEVDAVADSLATSSRGQGGQQKVAIAALMLFLEIEPGLRNEIADSLVPRGRRSMETELGQWTLSKIIHTASRLTTGNAEKVLADAEKRLSRR